MGGEGLGAIITLRVILSVVITLRVMTRMAGTTNYV